MKGPFRFFSLFLLATAAAFCGPITWTLSNADFNDGGTLTGTFVLNVDTGVITSWNIVSSAGDALAAFTYTPANSTAYYLPPADCSCGGSGVTFTSNQTFPNGLAPPLNFNENRLLNLYFTSALTDSGGSASLYLNNSQDEASNECLDCDPYRLFNSGLVSAPAPQTLTFDAIPTQIFGVQPFPVAAEASSSLPVTFTSTTPLVCKIADDLVIPVGTGLCSITANQAGSASYQPAAASQSFSVNKANFSGTLTPALNSPITVGSLPLAAAVGDFNRDGKPDLAVVDQGSGVSILIGNGSGGFTAGAPISVGSQPRSVAVGDFNGDGFQDLAVVNPGDNNVTILLGNGSGGFSQMEGSPFPVGSSPTFVAIGDFNRDGIQDLAVTNQNDNSVTVLLGNGSGGFSPASELPFPVGSAPLQIVVADFNGDGNLDLATANLDGANVTVLLGNGSGGFSPMQGSPFATGVGAACIAVGDFNGDGIPDIAVANLTSANVTVLLGSVSGGFTTATGSPFQVGSDPIFITAADFNGDGIADLATANAGSNNVTVLLGNGSGGFAPGAGSPFPVGTAPYAIVAADFNLDGISDLATANVNSNNVSVLLGVLSPTSSVLTTISPLSIIQGQSVPLALNVSDTGTAFNPITGTATFTDTITDEVFILGTASQTGTPYMFNASSLAVGTHMLAAGYGGGSGNIASNSNTITIQVYAPQTITFNSLSGVVYGVPPFGIGASSTSGLTVALTSNSMSVCTVNVATVTIVGTGTCSITASQMGNGTYAPAQSVTQTFNVAVDSQTITFDAIPTHLFGVSPFPIAAQSTSLLPVAFTSTTPSVCKTASGLVTLLSAGTCGITASQPGNSDFSAAPAVMRSFAVNQGYPASKLVAAAGSPVTAGTVPTDVAVGDFNGDGIPDLAVANSSSGNLTVLLGNGMGGFTPTSAILPALGADPVFVVVADFNGDGFQDLAAANAGSGNVTVLLGNGMGGFAPAPGSPVAVGAHPVALAVGDFNGDGIQDLVAANSTGGNITVLLGNGIGGFAPASGSPFPVGAGPASVAVGDFNRDGAQDLAVANALSGNVTLLLGNGAGGFAAAPSGTLPVGTDPDSVAIGDFNGDGIPDLAVANGGGNNVTVLLGSIAGTFTTSGPFGVGSAPASVVVGDFNGDGIADLATTNAGDGTVTLLLGNGSGSFASAPSSPFGVGTTPGVAAVGDFNRDGILDIAVPNAGSGNVTVLLGSPALAITTVALPNGMVGQPYGPVLMTASGGLGNYYWSAGGLPPGVTISTGGLISGTPTSAPTLPFGITVTVSDLTTGFSATTTYTVTVSASPLVISSSASSLATVPNGAISAAFTVMGGTSPYTLSASGLPAGVLFSATGALSGAPTQAGTFSITVTVTDANGNTAAASIVIFVLGLTTQSLPNGMVGQTYFASIGATGGSGGYTFSASGAPPGLTLSPIGSFSGVPTTADTYTVGVTVSSGGLSVSGTFSVTIAPSHALSFTGMALPNGTVNVPYSQSLMATGGKQPYSWSLVSGTLPQGLSLSATGIVAGTPGMVVTSSFNVQVTDSAGAAQSGTVTLVIAPTQLTILTTSLPDGMNSVDYPKQILSAAGGVPPYTWTLNSGVTLPSGMSFSGGVLSGTPGTTGTFSVGVTVTDTAKAQAMAVLSLNIRPLSANLILTTSSLQFSLTTPGGTLPATQTVGVQSTVQTQQLNYTLSVNPSASWLSVANGTVTPDSVLVSVTSAALSLSPGAYSTTIATSCTSTACPMGNTQTVSVTLNVAAAPPILQITNTLLSFATTTAALGPMSQPINITNAGGGSLTFNSISCEASWCGTGAAPVSLAGNASASVAITVAPNELSPGFYRTQVDIFTNAGEASVPVTLFISPASTMTLAPAGAQFNMPAGSSPGNPNGSFLVSVNSTSAISFNAAIVGSGGLPAPTWLTLGTPGGSSSSTQPATVSFSINATAAAALAPGAYYGQVEITSTDLSNSPQDFEVILNVSAPNSAVAPDPEPGGLLFITSVGGVLPAQTVDVYSSSVTPLTVQAYNGGTPWLSVTPGTGPASTSSPDVTSVSVNATGLAPGVYTAGVSYSLQATDVQTVNVTLIVTSATGGIGTSSESSLSSASPRPRLDSCSPSVLVPAQTGLVNSFSAPAGWPTALQIVLANDCGSLIDTGQIVATFTNGDPPLALPLANASQALYSGTWSPAKASSQVAVTVTATAPGYPAATSQLLGSVLPNAVPVLTPNGTLHAFDPLVGGALAPGTIVAIYGQNLASSAAQPSAIPLPANYNGTVVTIGGKQAPLYYVSPTQINAQIPFELQSGGQYSVIVSANGALTTPSQIQLSPATPGLAAESDGTLIAQNVIDGSLVTASSPATPGEYVVAYLAGMGDTSVPVTSGTASPSNPLATPSAAPVLTINGTQYPLLFAGLTPGLVGLYQIDFQVPAGLSAGTLSIAVSQNGQTSNQTTLPYQP